MWDLFKSEAMRFRGWTAALAGAHLIALMFMTRLEDLAQQRVFVHTAFGGLYALLGLLLGLYQMGVYRKPSRWLNLLHRPLPRARIAAALTAAGVLQLVVVVTLPTLLVAVLQATTTARVLDLRHWMLPVSALLVASCAYFAGAFCTLRGPVYAIAVLPLLWALPASNATGFGLLAVELLVLGWLALLLLDAFRPDLSAPPRGSGAVVTALPMQMGVYALMIVLFVGFELVWIAQGSQPNNAATPPAGGHNEVERADPRDRVLAGLQGSQHPDAALLREWVQRSDPQSIPVVAEPAAAERALQFPAPRVQRSTARRALGVQPRRHAIAWTPPARWQQPRHARRGRDPGAIPRDRRAGVGTAWHGRRRSAAVRRRYAVSARAGDTAGDRAPPRRAGRSAAGCRRRGSERRRDERPRGLLLREQGADGRPSVAHACGFACPCRGKVGDLRNLDILELPEGYLAAFVYSARSGSPVGVAPYQILLRAHDDGRIETLNRRELHFDYPAVYRYRAWWISPVLYASASCGARSVRTCSLRWKPPIRLPCRAAWLGWRRCCRCCPWPPRLGARRVLRSRSPRGSRGLRSPVSSDCRRW